MRTTASLALQVLTLIVSVWLLVKRHASLEDRPWAPAYEISAETPRLPAATP